MNPDNVERSQAASRSRFIAKNAIVVGAGIAGLTAAEALADWFERVTVLERDRMPDQAVPRPGTPQAWHVHGLLVGGMRALEELFPHLGEDLSRAGAVPIRISQDLREEFANRDPMPQRDFGMVAYTMTRALLETTLKQRAMQRSNIVFRQNLRVLGILAGPDGRRVTSVRFADAEEGSREETLPADLVVDASGRGQLTIASLQSMGRDVPDETEIGIDLGYTTAIMEMPDDAPVDWKVVLTHANAPHSTRRGLIFPIEGHRWMMTAAGCGGDRPPGEWTALLAFLRQFSTPTIYNAVRNSTPIGRMARFGFPHSIWRHFERLTDFPDGLIPIGDAFCRFNPIYGQGMTVAAKEACLLHRLLGARASEPDPVEGLGRAFLAEAGSLIETPWMMAAIPDFAYPHTSGKRPPDLENSLRFSKALSRVAVRDASVQKLANEVWHMLKPRSVLQDPAIMRQVEAEMTEMAGA
ncbi:MAG TPA: FAD-dependent monooxygenase [Acetobacteraceae bacterium]|nr:FAD-dependent monooxygenase [Acetobacteraceae bacterium]